MKLNTDKSSLYNGTIKYKNDPYFNVIGDFDELNANLGLLNAFHSEILQTQEIKTYTAPVASFYKHLPGVDSGKYYEWFVLGEYINHVQHNIMDISSFIGTPPYDNTQKIVGSMEDHLEKWSSKVGFDSLNYTLLEKDIFRLQEITKDTTNFIVPPGNKLIAQIYIVRAITRRCERNVINLYNSEECTKYIGVYPIIDLKITNIKMYLNRLSNYFFALSKFVGMTLEKI